MKELKSLVKTNLRSNFNIILGEEKRNKNKINIILLFIFFNVLLEVWVTVGFNILHKTNNEGVLLNSIINLEFMIITGLVFFKIMNTFYLASDWKQMLIYPIKIGSLLLSKAILCYISVMSVSACLTIPLLSYGILSSASPTYYLKAILYQIIIPFIPTIYISLISLTIFWIIAEIKKINKKHKTYICVIVVSVTVIILTYILLNPILNKDGKINNLLFNIFFNGNTSFLMFYKSISLVIKFIIVLSIVTISCLGFYFAYGNVYLTIMKSRIFSSKDSKNIEVDIDKFEFKKRGIIVSNIIRDAKLIMRMPALRFNCVTAHVAFSAICLILLILFREQVMIEGSESIGAKSFLILIWILTFTLPNLTLITSFSREGRALNQFKVFPISSRKIMLPKIYIGMLTNIFEFLSTNILIVLISSDFAEFMLLELVTIIYMILVPIIQIALDLRSMELKWVSIKSLFQDTRLFKVFKPYFIITLLPFPYLVIVEILNIDLTEWLTASFVILIGVIYSIPSFRVIKTNLK